MSATIRDQVSELLASKRQWCNGETVLLCEGQGCRVTVTEGQPKRGGFLFLEIRNGKPGVVAEVLCGYLRFDGESFGWVESLTDDLYNGWVKEAKAKVIPGGDNGQS